MQENKKKNPLFVVTNEGRDVEEAQGFWDAIVKKCHLGPFIDFLNIVYEMLLENVRSYAWFKAITDYINQLLQTFFEMMKFLKIA